MKCTICKGDTVVLATDGNDRRRKCVGKCGHRFTTTEVLKDDWQRDQEAVQTVIEAAEKLKAAA